jgi:integrase
LDEKAAVVPKEFHKQKNEGRYLLNSKMIKLLKRRQKKAGESLYVFWRSENGSGKHINVTTRWIQYKWAGIRTEAGIKDLRFYDLKHTCLSRLAAMGASVFLLKAVSNHATTASLERYIKNHALKEPALDLLDRMNGVET